MANAVKVKVPSPALREIVPEDLPVGEGNDPETEAPEAPAESTAVGKAEPYALTSNGSEVAYTW